MQIRPFRPEDETAVTILWQRCELTRPWNDPHKDIQRKLTTQPELFLVGERDGLLVASVMAGFDGHRGWVNYLAVDPRHRGQGLGRKLMEQVERSLVELGCPKLNLQVRSGNQAVLAFYRRLGYGVEPLISLGKRLIADD
jgi:ribosomal protein S18 acetylase RimI-like enzyme